MIGRSSQESASALGRMELGHRAHEAVGRTGMVWFLASEAALFGSLMGLYVLFATRAFGWEETKQALDETQLYWATLWLALASIALAQARRRSGAGKRRMANLWLALGLLCGVLFLTIKGIGYAHDWQAGFTLAGGPFWQFYYLLTGLHAAHVLGGLVGALWVWWTTRGAPATAPNRWQALLLYWAFLDVVWLALLVLFLRW